MTTVSKSNVMKRKQPIPNRKRLLAKSRDPLKCKIESILQEFGSDSDDEPKLNPKSPVFKSLQEDLDRQLSSMWDQIDGSVYSLKKEKSTLIEKREDVGCVLYNAQQMLVQAQGRLKAASASLEENKTAHEKSKLKLEAAQAVFDEMQAVLRQRIAEFERSRDELNRIDNEIRAIEEKRQNEISELVIQRRIAYKTEQDVAEQEISKNEQDMYIQKLYERLQSMRQKLEKLEAQIIAQCQETKKAQRAVLEAGFEDERLRFEREQLLKDWDTAVLGVKFRLMTLERIQTAYNEQEGKILELKNEIQIVKLRTKEAKLRYDRNSEIMARIQRIVDGLDAKILNIQKSKQEKTELLAKLNNDVLIRESRNRELIMQRSIAKQEYQQCFQSIAEMSQQIRLLEQEIDAAKEAKKRNALEILAAEREAIPVRRMVDLKKQKLCNLANERIRLQMDFETTEHEVKFLTERLASIKQKISEQNELLDQYESEILKNNNEIDRNMAEIERLNRLYEQGSSRMSDRPGNDSLELKLYQIREKIKDIRISSDEKQDQWMKLQTELVALSKQCEDLQRDETNITSEVAVLQRKRDKTAAQLAQIQKENQKYQIHVRVFETEIRRLNEQLQKRAVTPLEIDTAVLEILTGKEREAAEIESKIEANHQKRGEAAEELLDVEKQIELLERKIQMAHEIGCSIDRKQEEIELNLMKKEVSKMEQRLADIKRMQDVIIKKLTVKVAASPDPRCEQLKSELAQIRADIEKNELVIRDNTELQKELRSEIEQCDEILREYESQADDFKLMVSDQERLQENLKTKLEKLKLQGQLFMNRNFVASLESFADKRNTLVDQIDQMMTLLDAIIEQFPEESHELIKIRDKIAIFSDR